MVLNVFKRERWQKAVLYHNKYKTWNNTRPLRDNAKRTGGVVQSVKGLETSEVKGGK